MRVWAIWHGGVNYTPSIIPRDVETFPSLSACKDALEERYNSNGRREVEFAYVNIPKESAYVPAVGTDSEFHVFFSDPSDLMDAYPDRRVYLSRNGRAYAESC